MRERYDFSNARQGVHHEKFQQGHRTRLTAEDEHPENSSISLDEDVRAVFPDSAAVNAALRSLIRAMRTVKAGEEAVPKAS